MPGNKRLRMLAVAHLALGVLTCIVAHVALRTLLEFPEIMVVPLFCSALCQSFLLSLWGTASQAKPWKRLAGLVAGAAYLEALLATRFDDDFLGIATVTIAVTTVALLVVRWLGVRFTRQEEVGQPARIEPEGLRFSIGGLMVFTAVVALLCTVARALQESPTHPFLLVLVWAICFVAVGLVCLWAALGGVRPPRRSPVVFALSPLLGVFFAFAANAHKAGWVYILLIMVLYPMALFGSLLIARSCGYRLVRPGVAPPFQRKTYTLPHFDHFIECFSKNSHIKSLAEMFKADFPRVAVGDLIPGQVCPPPSIATKTTSVPWPPAA